MELTGISRGAQILNAYLVIILLVATGCSGASGQRAAEGAGTGALAGAAAGLVGGLLWGDPLEGMAQGAVTGGVAGGVAGGIYGSKEDKAQQQTQAKQYIEDLRSQIGPDAFTGAVALAECKHGVAEANAQVAAESTDSNYALAGLWLESLSLADRGDMEGAQALFPEILRWDRSISATTQAQAELDQSLLGLQDIREQYNLPRSCTS